MYCVKCGKKIPDDSQFCPMCGAPVPHEEESLISKARRGDNDAIHQLMNDYRGMVRYQARMYVKNEDDVNEIEQETFIRAFKNLSTLDDENKFGSWLKTIAINTAKNYVTTAFKKRSVMFTDLDDTNNDMVYDAADERIDHRPEVQMDETARQEIIMKVLQDLPQDQQDVIVMHFYNDLSFREIAEELGVPMSTVTGRAQQAKNSIKASVTAIQNRDGIKLYHLSPLAFFIWLLGLEKAAPVEPPVIGKTVRIDPQKVAAKDKPHYGNPENNGNKTVKVVKETAKTTAKNAGRTTAKAATKATAGKAAGTGFLATKAGKAVVAGAIAVAAAGGGGAVGAHLYQIKNSSGNTEIAKENVNGKKKASREVRLVWVKEPGSLDIDGFENLEGHPGNVDHGYTESTGYSPEWIGSMSNYNMNTEGSYSGNAIIVMNDKKKGIYDFDGNVIDDVQYDSIQAGNEVGAYFYGPSDAKAFDDLDGYFDYDFNPVSGSDDGWIANSDGGSFYLYNGSVNGNGEMSIDSFTNVVSGPLILPVMDQYYSDADYSNNISDIHPSGFAILEAGKGETDLPDGMEPLYFNARQKDGSGTSEDMDLDRSDSPDRYESFVNGVVKLRDKNKKIHLWSYDIGDYVSDQAFDDATFYEDGYVGVKKNGKWAFMDEDGKLVSDYIFDQVSGLYEGKAYVKYKGKIGILDVKKTIENTGSEKNQKQKADFSVIAGNYSYMSGVGGWATMLKVSSDGSFTGEYHDSDMGDTGSGYPNGTEYYAKFSGKFKDIRKVNDKKYQITLDGDLKYDNRTGTTKIKDGILYHYTDAYGFEDTDTFTVVMPGSSMNDLDSDVKKWIYGADDQQQTKNILLINDANDETFVGY